MAHLNLYQLKFIDIDDCGELYYIYEDVWAVDYQHAAEYLANKYDVDWCWIELC